MRRGDRLGGHILGCCWNVARLQQLFAVGTILTQLLNLQLPCTDGWHMLGTGWHGGQIGPLRLLAIDARNTGAILSNAFIGFSGQPVEPRGISAA